MSGGDIWFHWYSGPGRFKSWPVNWKGWLAIFALVLAEGGVLALVYSRTADPSVRIPFLAVSLVAVAGLAFWLTFAKGKRVSSLNPGSE